MASSLPLPLLSAEDIARFWAHVDRSGGPEACWPWIGDHVARGYGRFKVRGRELKPHRVALYLTTGVDPGARHGGHSCDNPPCCNPAHLAAITAKQNSRDRQLRGRGRAGRGARHGTKTHPESHARGSASMLAKLTEPAIEEAARRYLAGGVTVEALAREYGVTREALSRAFQGKAWAHVPIDRAAIAALGRQNRAAPGERHASARLHAEQVRAVRASKESAKVLAAHYGVTKELIYAIRSGRAWKHLR